MRFLSMVRINEQSHAEITPRLMEDMGKLMEEMTKAGILVSTAGLRPTYEGVRVKLSKGRTSLVDGPFAETKEVIGGYAILETKTKEEAIEATRRFLLVHGDAWELECELRQIEEPAFDGAGC